jgi:outer membrane protein TolC
MTVPEPELRSGVSLSAVGELVGHQNHTVNVELYASLEGIMKALIIQVILIAIISACANAAVAAPLTLEDCVTQAIHHSPALSAARHDTQAAREGVTEQRAALLPFLSAQTTAYEVNGAPANPFTALRAFDAESPRRNAHWGPVGIESIGLTYPLIQNGSILGLNNPPEVAAARAAVDEKLAGILLIEQKVVFDTVTAYLYAAWYRNEAPLASRIVQLTEERFEIVKYQAQLGLKLPQDVELASAQVVAARRVAAEVMLNAGNSVAALAAMIGRPDDDIAADTTLLPTPPLPPLREFLAHVMLAHPALRVQQGQIEIAQQQVRVDTAALYPSVKLNLGLTGAQDLGRFNGGTLSNFLSFIQVDIPIFDFGRRRASVRASKEGAASALDSLNAIDLALRNSISQTYHQIFDADERVTAFQTYGLKVKNAAALAGAEHNEGLIDELTWVEAQLQVPAAEIALGQAQLLMQLQYAELRNLSGGIWHWLDNAAPSEHPIATQQLSTHITDMGRTNLKHPDSNASDAPPVLWYLFMPPSNQDQSAADVGAPFSRWIQGRSFDTAENCESARKKMLNVLKPARYNYQMFQYAGCIAANDPRIRSNREKQSAHQKQPVGQINNAMHIGQPQLWPAL